jgi:HK97 gp10 family phage protein
MTVKGLDQLHRRFKRIPVAVKRAAIASVVEGANEVAALQRRLVPVDDGDLKASITVTPPGQSTPPYSQPGGQRVARETEAIVTAGNTKVRYAHLVEFGTAPHENGGMFEGTQNPGAKAQPFFWPSYRAVRRQVRSRISRSISKAIRDEGKK